jgi:HPt (histidine-containing phosphotransfer) domain-containing protein
LAEALAERDIRAIQRTAHSLKGSSGNLGLSRFSALAAGIERLARQERAAEAQARLARQERAAEAQALLAELSEEYGRNSALLNAECAAGSRPAGSQTNQAPPLISIVSPVTNAPSSEAR